MNKMKTVVITGSTRGIGFAMAEAFLKKGCRVVVSGRKNESVKARLKQLVESFSSDQAAGYACDVTSYEDLQKLWDYSIKKFGSIDIWVNNAGISNELSLLPNLSPKEIKKVVETNILGEIYGTQIALKEFEALGAGAIYNMEGMGAKKGRMVDGLSIYGTTKSGLRFFNDAIAQENKNGPILIGALLPGMMLTEMVTNQYEGKPEDWNKVKNIFSAIAEDVNVVADWMTDKMLANQKNGVRFQFSNTFKTMLRMLKMLIKR
jgi:NAD(P)-dependent dehydrogenase (short-subunit alcohol dehydrogenase family)